MGIDYLVCANKNCGEGFPDVRDYVSCECGKSWCSDECAEEDGFFNERCKLGYDIDDNTCDISCWECKSLIESSCKYCRGEDFDDKELLEFLLWTSNIDREELINEYKRCKIEKEDK